MLAMGERYPCAPARTTTPDGRRCSVRGNVGRRPRSHAATVGRNPGPTLPGASGAGPDRGSRPGAPHASGGAGGEEHMRPMTALEMGGDAPRSSDGSRPAGLDPAERRDAAVADLKESLRTLLRTLLRSPVGLVLEHV